MAQLIYQDKRGADIVRLYEPRDGDEALRILSRLRCEATVRLSDGSVAGRVERVAVAGRRWYPWVDFDAVRDDYLWS